jgi:hypothetical protein
MYFNNLLKNPTVPRYRRMSTINGSYVKSLSTVQHHTAVLTAVGFQQKADSTYYEYEWHTLPTAVAEVPSSKDKDGKGTSKQQNDNSRSAPATVGEARILLEEAVQLLGALKTSRTALLQSVLGKMAGGETSPADDGTSGSTPQGPAAGVKVSESASAAESLPPSSTSGTSAGSSNISGTAVSAPLEPTKAASGVTAAPDQQLISVADVTEGDGRLLSSGRSSDSISNNLDFIKVRCVLGTVLALGRVASFKSCFDQASIMSSTV